MKSADAGVQAYLDALPLPEEERQRLMQSEDFLALQRSLAHDADADLESAVRDSAATRLQLATGEDFDARGLLGKDRDGQPRLLASPPLQRTSMLPEPWRINPLTRLWRRLTGRAIPPRKPQDDAPKSTWQRVGQRRRMVMSLLMLCQTVVATWYMTNILPYQGWSLIELHMLTQQSLWDSFVQVLPYLLQTAILVLFSILFCWVSAGFWTALMGFWALLRGDDRFSVSGRTAGSEPIAADARTALVMPICNEDVSRVFAGLRATYESLQRSGELEHFDFYVLSDTGNPDIAVAEQRAWLELCQATGGFGRIFYRRRRRRVKRKSGNIDDFCRRWGAGYRYMVVLDADSVMSGDCLSSLVRLMEKNPKAGIIQSAPRAAGMGTLYARIQQFATAAYGPLFTAGLHFWQLGESHYWGHNAIIRIKPFVEHCALAPLPGKGSFAGAILSHDFVEAALMRRAGWGVWIAYDLPGSYEELPPNLLDELKRDRRWCHGNLMNFRLFLVKGMHPVHRAVFLTGVMSYLSAPLWFLFLVLSTALLAIHTLTEPRYFLAPGQLFPVWPRWNPQLAITLFSTTMTLLFLPKLLSVILIWAKGAASFGGKLRVVATMLMEMLFSVLLAPVRMLFHTQFVTAAFLGWAVKWDSPQRDDGSTPWSEAFTRHLPHTLLAIGWIALVYWLDPSFLWWLAPIVGSLLLATPVSALSSRPNLGQISRRLKLFLIPEESNPPRELTDTYAFARQNRQRELENGFLAALFDPFLNALACAMAPARHGASALIERARQRRLEALANGPQKLPEKERLAVLDDPQLLSRAHARLWPDAAQRDAWLAERSTSDAAMAHAVTPTDLPVTPQAAAQG